MIAFDTFSSGSINPGTTLTVSHTCSGSNRILLVGVRVANATEVITGVTYNGVAMTQAKKVQSAAGNEWWYLYYLINPASGANNIVVSTSSSVVIVAVAESLTGASQTGQPDSSGSNSQTGVNTLTLSTTVVAANCWLVSMEGCDAGGTPSAGAGTTIRVTESTFKVNIGDSNGTVGTGSQSMVWNNTDSTHTESGCIVSIAPALAAGGISGFEI